MRIYTENNNNNLALTRNHLGAHSVLPVMDSVLRLQQFGPQVSNGHLLLLKRGEVLLRVWRSDAMVVPTQVVGS